MRWVSSISDIICFTASWSSNLEKKKSIAIVTAQVNIRKIPDNFSMARASTSLGGGRKICVWCQMRRIVHTASNPLYTVENSISPPFCMTAASTARVGTGVDVFMEDRHPDPGRKLYICAVTHVRSPWLLRTTKTKTEKELTDRPQCLTFPLCTDRNDM